MMAGSAKSMSTFFSHGSVQHGRFVPSAFGLTPPTSAHSSTAGSAHRTEVLGTLCSFAAHFLFGLQLWLRLVDCLPATSTVARPVATLPVVAVHTAVLARIDGVLTRGDTCIRVGVVNEATAIRGALATINVANISRAATGHDSSIRVVRRSASIAG